MIKKANAFQPELRENMRDGKGTVKMKNFVSPADLNDKGRLFGTITLEKGCSIGYHVHEKDAELFYILKGKAKYNDNGTEVTVEAGDVCYCATGTGHSIEGISEEAVELVALIVYA